MTPDDDDWPFPPGSSDIDRYRDHGKDLSDPINQGQRVSDLRTLANLFPQQLALEVGFTVSELLAIEAGLLTLSQTVAFKLSTAVGVQYADLRMDSSLQ